MEIIKTFFKNIDKEDIDENTQNLVSNGLIDSIDIIGLVSQIEEHYKKPLDADFIEIEHFESMSAIKDMIEKWLSTPPQ